MKKLLLVMLCLGFAQAHGVQLQSKKKMTAAELRQFLEARSTKSGKSAVSLAKTRDANTNPGGISPVELQPIRNGKFKAEIYKMTIQKLSDGSYSINSRQVCIANGTAPVYDARGLTDFTISSNPMETCFTTVGGQAVEVKIAAFLTLENYAMFSDESPADYKSAISWFTVASSPETSSADHSASRSLTTSSMIQTMAQFPVGVCTNDGNGNVTCENVEGEYFSGVIETVD